jgi:glycosyltransferase involved in cell wall biosynthesis
MRDKLPDGISLTDLKTPRLRHSLGRLRRLIRGERPDVIFSSIVYLNVALIIMRFFLGYRPALVVREANILSLSLRNVRYGRVLAFLVRRFYRHADAVIATSARMALDLVDTFGVPTRKIHILENPVLIEGNIGKKASVNAGIVVSAGRLVEQKGFDLLLSWMTQTPAKWCLKIFGDGPLRELLEEQISASGLSHRVQIFPFDLTWWQECVRAGVFVLPSRWEGMPNAALEALALGTPVVATSTSGGLPELVDELPSGALQIVDDGSAFIEAIEASLATSDGVYCPRETLLPKRFQSNVVGANFNQILITVVPVRLN